MSGQDDLQALRASLDALRREHAIVRMRLAETIAAVETRKGERAQLLADLAAREAERDALAAELSAARAEGERLAAVLAQDGHRLVARAAAFRQRHPRLGGILQALVRLALRIAGRG